METETLPAGPSHGSHFVFFNDRGLRAGWRLLIYFAILFLLGLAITVISKVVAGKAHPSPPPQVVFSIQMVFELMLFLLLLLAAWIMSRIERRPMGAYGLPLQRSMLPAFGAGYVLWGFLPLTLLLLLLRACGAFYFGPLSPLSGAIFGWGLFWGAFFLLVGFFEEYLFRGYMLYTLADGIGFWPSTIILAIAFGGVHMGNAGESRIGIVAAGFFALFAAATLRRTGNLWLAVGAHAGWDWGESFFFGVSDSGFQSPGHLFNPHAQGPDWLTGGTVGPEGSVLTLIFWMAMTVLFLWYYRRGPALVVTYERKNA